MSDDYLPLLIVHWCFAVCAIAGSVLVVGWAAQLVVSLWRDKR